MTTGPPQPPDWLRSEARQVYGDDPEGYDRGRPDYPERVYELLEARCGIGPGARVVEIGPGTGLVTRRLLRLGAHVTGVEPDPALARYLEAAMTGRPVDVVAEAFEDAPLADAAFDAAVAAMSFHWVDQHVGLPKLRRVVRPGGWVALWWTVFGDPDRPDPFRDATEPLLRDETTMPADARARNFELDVVARMSDLERRARLADVSAELIRWTIRLDAPAVEALYASTIAVRRRPAEERARLLDGLRRVATEDFGGVVDRPFVTAIYTGRRA